MKRIMCLILTMLFLFYLNIITYAANVPMKEVIEKFNDNVEEKNKIKEVVLKDEAQPLKDLIKFKKDFKVIQNTIVTSEDDLILGEPYKIIHFPAPMPDNITSAFEGFIKGKRITDILQNATYYYEVPVLMKQNNAPVSSIQVKIRDTGKWGVTLYPGYLDPEISYIVSQPEKVVELLKSLGIETVDKYMHVSFGDGYDFLYTLSDNKEYFIPLQTRFGTEQFKVYTRGQFQAIFAPLMEKVLNDEELPIGGGASFSKNDNKMTNIRSNNEVIYIALSFGVIVAVSLLYIVRNKIKHKTL
ncbi:hypothetical protein SAMN02746089_00910 [Caldanaerobius fijiensis DSM 17918]|uniref:Uncharacterized protein n=1 Tax=Caldanaerobius fijiensis DSM 17918 TaxID=1121256 RepID=A0A1M4WZS2_9THEO|nr:hypothetical protein [Caldanaerobius fijiensis]SHE86748.1 hypothetical protein SAMN02746089_00910 [Caldanaerobius fijiensis DSM 17918]